MNRVSAAVTAGLVMSAAGLLIALASTFRLVQTGLFTGDYVAPGQLDFEAVAFAVLGIGLFVSGLAFALVGLADIVLGALPADSVEPTSDPAEEARQAPADPRAVVPRPAPPARASSAPDRAGYEPAAYEPARHASVQDEPRGYVPEGRVPERPVPVDLSLIHI
ncbi:hypothetical protein FRIG_15500 [Frigoribacterium faeni]|uniref:hypothetical protein n=1 Tax=Frigoribacterium faeni TaxID=145483 RepID=UPI001FAC30CB|nr:hypothetical protein [Frigoribacterium faeni]MCJ0702520.1 hypothetical protein [Frigoribacterium faeni]